MSRRPDGMPWSKFWWQDYDRDPALRRCSLEAEGLWMRLLCIMAEAEPYGRLLVGGTVPTAKEIARMVGRGLTERAVSKLMAELLKHKVYSLDDDGVPHSRRMVREVLKREEARIYGARGGNPALKKGGAQADSTANSAEMPEENTENISGHSHAESCDFNGLRDLGVNPTRNPPDKLQEARGEKPDNTGSLRSPAAPNAAPVDVEVDAVQVTPVPEQLAVANVEALPARDLLGPLTPAEPQRPTPGQVLYREGLAKMIEMTGRKPDAIKSWFGRMRRETGDNAALILEAVQDAHRRWLNRGDDERADPTGWVAGYVKARAKRAEAVDAPVPEFAGADRWKVSEVVDHCGDIMKVGPDGCWKGFSQTIAEALEKGADPDLHIYPVMREVHRRGWRTVNNAGFFAFAIAGKRRDAA